MYKYTKISDCTEGDFSCSESNGVVHSCTLQAIIKMKKITKPVMANQLGLEELTDAQMEAQTGGSINALQQAYLQGQLTTIANNIRNIVDVTNPAGLATVYTLYNHYSQQKLTTSEKSLLQNVSSLLTQQDKLTLWTLYKAP